MYAQHESPKKTVAIVNRTQDETKTLYSEAIRQNIAKKNWAKLAEVMLVADRAGVLESLQSIRVL